jgi:hypothetical protein
MYKGSKDNALCMHACMHMPPVSRQVTPHAAAHPFLAFVVCVHAVPITLRLLVDEDQFKRGPFHLGRWSKPIAAVAFCWALLACVIFILPQVLPVTAEVSWLVDS